jgi:hypothetical protein
MLQERPATVLVAIYSGEVPTPLPVRFATLPGAELIEQGLTDLAGGREDTVPALVVLVGAPRLRAAGIDVPASMSDDSPEDRLYLLLAKQHDDGAQGIYNALIQGLVSFTQATDHLSPPA